MSLIKKIHGVQPLATHIHRGNSISVSYRLYQRTRRVFIVTFAKMTAERLGMSFNVDKPDLVEAGYDASSGSLFLAVATHLGPGPNRRKLVNRHSAMVLTLPPYWLPDTTPLQPATGVEFTIHTDMVDGTEVKSCEITLPDWAAPEEAERRAARARGEAAARAAQARLNGAH